MNSVKEIEANLPISPTVLKVPRSATLAINEKSKDLVKQGKEVFLLGLGQSPFPIPDIMVSALQDNARAKDYMAVQGFLPLREAIASYINRTEGLQSSANDVIVGPGTKELLFGLQLALDCDLVLPAPSWVSYDPQARILNKKVHWLPCFAKDGWKLTAETLQQHCEQQHIRQQLLIINSPNNPSGACFTESELRDLADVARRYGLFIVSDEIYSQLHFQGNHISLARYYPEGTIISNGISKWAGAGGWRLGFFVFPVKLKPILDAMLVIASESFTSVSAPIQMASICAFDNSPEMLDYINASRRIMATVGTQFSNLLMKQNVHNVAPDGGFYTLADFSAHTEKLHRAGIQNSPELCQRLLMETGVAGLPGNDFGLKDGFYVRFALVDFEAEKLLHRVLTEPDIQLDLSTEQLRRIFTANKKITDWITNLP